MSFILFVLGTLTWWRGDNTIKKGYTINPSMKIFNNLMEEWNVDQRLIQKACRIFKNINVLMTSEILGKNGEEKDKKGKNGPPLSGSTTKYKCIVCLIDLRVDIRH